MLTELRIHNFAIIDQLDLRFGPGLIILTGETGAGKSIILDAVVMLIGGKADTTSSAPIQMPRSSRVCSTSRVPKKRRCTSSCSAKN